MKWIGQHIWDFISRFRSDVYLENISDGTVEGDKFLGLDVNNKIVKETVSTTVIDLHGAGVDGSANQLLTDDGDGTVTSESTLTYDGSVFNANCANFTIENATTGTLSVQNTGQNSTGGTINIKNTNNGVDASDSDYCGQIEFWGQDDGTPTLTKYASINTQITDVANSEEAATVRIQVLNGTGTGGLKDGLRIVGNTDVEDQIDVTISSGAASTTTIAGKLVVTGTPFVGWHGSTTRIKILHSDFLSDDGGRPLMIDDTGVASEELFLETFSTFPAYVTMAIPTGYAATHVMIYGSGTGAVEVWEHQINSKTGVSKGTGNIDTEIDITDVTSSATNYLFIQVAAGSDEIHGGYVTIGAV